MTEKGGHTVAIVRASFSIAAFCAVGAICSHVLRQVSAREIQVGWIGAFDVLIISGAGVLAFMELLRLGVTWRGAPWRALTRMSGMNPVINGALLLCVAGLVTLGHVAVYWPPATSEAVFEAMAAPAMIVAGELLLIRAAPST